MNVVLAHHWLVGMRGGEKVLEELGSMFPKAPIYTMVARPERLSEGLRRHELITSLLDRLPGGRRYYKQALPAFPAIMRGLKVRAGADLLISSDASVVKGIGRPEGLPHVCYCHSPPRYLSDLQETYLRETSGLGPLGRLAFRASAPYVRAFDKRAAAKVDWFIANSKFVQSRIREAYGREATVINPPVAIDDFTATEERGDYYLVVSELAPYKRIDIAVDAFNGLGKRLVIIGQGSERARLERRANRNIEFLGAQPFAILKHHYEHCRAFVFPGIEDFGITPLEAQAAGKPVIGYAAGGLLETTIEGETAIHFREQTAEALMAAVRTMEETVGNFQAAACRANAERFGPGRFRSEISAFLAAHYPQIFDQQVTAKSGLETRA
jgi:glycosyltransferase involved in cell wall biosynthesis